MRYWALNIAALQNDKMTIVLKARYAPRILEGDEIILFSREYQYVLFKGYSTIETPPVPLSYHNLDDAKAYKVSIKSPVYFKEQLTLEELAFSLQKIYRYRKPFRHFLRTYTTLTSFDFETLIQQRIFWSRTAFGLYVNALSEEEYADFVMSTGESASSLATQQASPVDAWQLLRKYIIDNYLAAANILSAILREAASLQGILKPEQLGLADPGSPGVDNIAAQSSLFTEFTKTIAPVAPNLPAFGEIDMVIEEHREDEDLFSKSFEGGLWPYQPEIRR